MTFESAPQDELITRVEQLDEALRQDSEGTVPYGDVPPGILAALKLLNGALGTNRSSGTSNSRAAIPEVHIPRNVGRFEVRDRLGGGSYGVVYQAYDTVLKRVVALKLPRLVTVLTDPLLRRFLRESEAAARLHHPHIVPVFEVGMEESTTFIAAEYCPGVSLESWLAARTEPLDPKLAATLLLDLADAIEHAHEMDVLHRDLKPGNILIYWELEPGETAANVPEQALAHAKITDFGLARLLDEGTMTASGGLIGTIAYMAPEQAEGQSTALSPQCDVYSLGVILYELLTGVRPHQGKNNADTLMQVCNDEPMPPRKRRKEIPRDLESICLKCLRKQAGKRYQTARELKEDLQRFLNGQATVARPLSMTEQLMRASRRHPGRVAFGVAFLAAAILGIIAVSWHFRELNAALVQSNDNWLASEAHRLRAEDNQRRAEELLYVSDMRLALLDWNEGHAAGFRNQLEKYRDRETLRGIEWELLAASMPDFQEEAAAHEGPIYASALSPDQRLLATVGQDRVVRLWDVATRTRQAELSGHTDEINALCFHPDGLYLATASDDCTVRVWNLKTGQTEQTLPHERSVFGVAWSPDGQRLVTGGKEKLIRVWSNTGELLFSLEPFGEIIEQLKFAPDGALAVAAGRVEIWNLDERRRIGRFGGAIPRFTTIEFSRDGKLLAGGSYLKDVLLWSVADESLLVTWNGHREAVHDVEFSPEGDFLWTCGRDGAVRRWPISAVWDGNARVDGAPQSQTATVAVPLDAHPGRTWSMTFLPEQFLLATTGQDGSIRYWPRQELSKPRFAAPDRPMDWASFSLGQRQLVSTNGDGVFFWDVKTGVQTNRFQLEPGLPVRAWGVSADGARVAYSLEDGGIRVRSSTGQGEPLLLQGHQESPATLLFPSSRSDLLISASSDGLVFCWDLRQGKELHRAQVSDPEPVHAALSPDGSLVAYADGDYTEIRSIGDWAEVSRWPCTDRRRPQAMAFSTDNDWLAVGCEAHTIELRRLDWPERVVKLAGSRNAVTSVAFSADGRTLFSGTIDGMIQAWHVATGQELGVLFQEDGVRVASLCFSPDGKKLLAAIRNNSQWPYSGLLLWEAR